MVKPTQSNQQKKSDTSIGQWNFTPDRQGSFDNYAWLGILLFLALIFLLPLKGDRLKQDLTFSFRLVSGSNRKQFTGKTIF